MKGVWEKISRKLSGAFGAAGEDTVDRVLRLQEQPGPHAEPVDPISEWRDDTAFLKSLVGERHRREEQIHVETVNAVATIVADGNAKPVASPGIARFRKF